jgi:hypothetical protein
MNVPELLADVTREREAAATAEATRVAMVLAVETSARESAVACYSTTILVKDAKDRAQERVSRVEVENAMALASAREDA